MESRDPKNAQNAEALILEEKIEKVKGLLADDGGKGTGIMDGIGFNIKSKTGFLFCPRCGLRRPKDEIAGYYAGYCPVCGCRLIEEGAIPYTAVNSGYAGQLTFQLSKKRICSEKSKYSGL